MKAKVKVGRGTIFRSSASESERESGSRNHLQVKCKWKWKWKWVAEPSSGQVQVKVKVKVGRGIIFRLSASESQSQSGSRNHLQVKCNGFNWVADHLWDYRIHDNCDYAEFTVHTIVWLVRCPLLRPTLGRWNYRDLRHWDQGEIGRQREEFEKPLT